MTTESWRAGRSAPRELECRSFRGKGWERSLQSVLGMGDDRRRMRASSTWLALLLIGCGNSPGGPTGAGGTTGSTGRAGTTGSAGSVGSAGTTGTGATTGIGGSAGIGGVTGSAGIGGVGGSAGIGGVGGSAGTTGVAGITGASGTTGLGGSPCQPSLPSDCGAAMCGNGKRDTCMLPGGTGSCLRLDDQANPICGMQDSPPFAIQPAAY